jgi:hypothetical protein
MEILHFQCVATAMPRPYPSTLTPSYPSTSPTLTPLQWGSIFSAIASQLWLINPLPCWSWWTAIP